MRDGFAVVGVDRLIAEPLRWIDPEVIHLFKLRFAVTAVVLVRRETAPMTGWVECFADHQPAYIRIAHKDVVHFADVCTLSSLVDHDVRRCHESSRPTSFSRSGNENGLDFRFTLN